jgi:hypothetical protein
LNLPACWPAHAPLSLEPLLLTFHIRNSLLLRLILLGRTLLLKDKSLDWDRIETSFSTIETWPEWSNLVT